MANKSFICLDVGEKRIGVAVADSSVLIAMPYETIEVDGAELEAIAKIVEQQNPSAIIVGYPRNQAGETTEQTKYVENFTDKLKDLGVDIIFQDESLTSVMAEDRLKAHNRPYKKADIDAQAATIILQDYLESNQ